MVVGLLLCIIAILVSAPILAIECWIWIISSGYVSSPTPGLNFLFTPNNYPLAFWSGPVLFVIGFLIYPTRPSKVVIGLVGLIPCAQAIFNLYFVYLEQAI
jgi:hypothetical protein